MNSPHPKRLGIISILPKGNKPRDFLKNWRPISLLNTTYKIFAGVIANRLKGVLNTIIHESQKGFLSGRFHCGQSITAYSVRLMFATVRLLTKSHCLRLSHKNVYFFVIFKPFLSSVSSMDM